VVIQIGAVKIYVAAVKAFRTKGKDWMELSLRPKLVEKLVWVPVILVCKILKFNIKKCNQSSLTKSKEDVHAHLA
jgi:hypothetical protein